MGVKSEEEKEDVEEVEEVKEFEQPSVAVPKSGASFNLMNKGLYGYRKQKTEFFLPKKYGRQSTLGGHETKKSVIF